MYIFGGGIAGIFFYIAELIALVLPSPRVSAISLGFMLLKAWGLTLVFAVLSVIG